ncbi:MAG: ABC transporter permease [Actinomycetia bacterium]|nr:ABC transporter permease [Actinomycetes bacterium]
MKTLFKKELLDNKWVVIISLVFVLLFTIFTASYFADNPDPIIENAKLTNRTIDTMLFNSWYMSGVFTGLGGPGLIFLISAAFLGTAIFGKEKQNNSFNFLFTRPASLLKIFLVKILAAISAMVIIIFLPAIFIPVFRIIANQSISFLSFFIAVLPVFFGYLAIFSLSLLASVITDFRRWAIIIALFIPIVWNYSFIALTAVVEDNQKVLRFIFDRIFFNLNWYTDYQIGYIPFIVGIGLTIACCSLSYLIIKKKEY